VSRRAETAVQDYQQHLEEYVQILEAVADGITAQDPSGRLIYANDAAARLVGFATADEMVSTPPAEIMSAFDVFDENGEPFPMERLPGRLALHGEEAPRTVMKFRVRATGEERWSIVKATPVLDDDGNVRCAVNVFDDITHEKSTEAELDRRTKQQEVVVRLGRRALGGVALQQLMDEAAGQVARTLELDHCSILELLDGEEALLMRSGFGWPEGVVGELRISSGGDTLAGYTLQQNGPVLTPNLTFESRYQRHPLLDELGVSSAVSVIIRAKTRPFGILAGFSSQPREFSEDDVIFMQAVANVLAAAAQRVWAEEVQGELLALERSAREAAESVAKDLRSIQKVTDAALAGLPLDELLSELLQRIRNELGADVAVIMLPEGEDHLAVRAAIGMPGPAERYAHIPIGKGLISRVAATRQATAVEDISDIEVALSSMKDLGVKSMAVIPLFLSDPVCGVLQVGTLQQRRFTPEDLSLLRLVADRATNAIEHARLLEAEQASRLEAVAVANRLALLQGVTSSLSEAVSEKQVCDAVIQRGLLALQAGAGSIALLDEDQQDLHVVTASGYPEELLSKFSRFPLDARYPLSDAVRTGRSIYVESVEQLLIEYPQLKTTVIPHKSLVAIPLYVEGRPVGGLGISFDEARRFGDEDKIFMESLAQQCAQALERARLYEAERDARTRSEMVQERFRFLARASEIFSGSLDYRETLSQVANLAVPHIADWVSIQMPEDDDIDRIVVTHSDPAKVQLAKNLNERHPQDRDALSGPANVMRTGQSELHPEILREMLEATAVDSEHLKMLLDLELRSVMHVPLKARGRTLGVLSLGSAESGRTYDEEDVLFAEELARHAALAIENARLFQEIDEGEKRFRHFVQGLGAIFWEADARTFQFNFVSKRAEELLGYPAARWQEPGFWASIIHAEDRAWAVDARGVATSRLEDHDTEYRVLADDGRVLWFKDLVTVLPGPSGKPNLLRGVMIDITEQKEAERSLEDSKERYAHLARTLQKSLLPPQLPEIQGFELAARYRPAGEGNEVGGDFFDVFRVGDTERAVVMGDVCGKGPKAAALTGLARHTVRTAALYESAPSGVLDVLNQAVLREELIDQFCTVALGKIEPNGPAARLTLAIGGHPLPYLLKADGSVRQVGEPGSILGVMDDPDLFDAVIDLDHGDVVVLYTDGVTDERGPEIDDGWLGAMLPTLAGQNVDTMVDSIERAAVDYYLPGEPRDDIALLVLRYVG
jgi:PAS domain S-box-containing protein